MEISTFEDDSLELSNFGLRLKEFIDIEDQFVQGSLVVALSAKFGFGKTTFLQMWKSQLESNEDKTKIPLVISLNAWESDYYGDPLFAIISSLVEKLPKRKKETKLIVNAAKDVGWSLLATAGQVVKKFTGVDFVEVGALAEESQ